VLVTVMLASVFAFTLGLVARSATGVQMKDLYSQMDESKLRRTTKPVNGSGSPPGRKFSSNAARILALKSSKLLLVGTARPSRQYRHSFLAQEETL
jgi:hypothetical protein